jgi:hypothetical protein
MQTHKVTIQMDVGGGVRLTHETEFIVADSDEAEEKGKEFFFLVMAFNQGWGSASNP